MRRNETIDWNLFNGDTYRHRHLNKLGKEDAWIAEQALLFLDEADIQTDQFKVCADIGTGPSLVMSLVCAPYAERIELVEPGIQNTTYLKRTTADPDILRREWSDALHVINSHKSAKKEHLDAATLLSKRAVVRQAGAQDLKPDTYDMVTSIFCAESATEDQAECSELIKRIVDSLKPGGVFISAYIEHSKAWPDFEEKDGTVNMQKFPSANISQAWLEAQFEGSNIQVRRCPHKPAFRAGYTGVLLAVGTK